MWGRSASGGYKQGRPGSVWFGYGVHVEWFEGFQFSVPVIPLGDEGFPLFSTVGSFLLQERASVQSKPHLSSTS